MIKRIRELFGRLLRSAWIWSVAVLALRSGGALLILPLLSRKLPTEELGLWYVFLSLGGIASFADLGFSSVIVRSTGYLWAGADRLVAIGHEIRTALDGTQPRDPNLPLLERLTATLRGYYFGLGFIVSLLLLTGGTAWIWSQVPPSPSGNWIRAAWILYAIGCGLATAGALWPNLLMGVNAVRQSERIFFAAIALSYVFTITGLLLGWGIWAVVIANVVMALTLRTIGKRAFLRQAFGGRVPRSAIDYGILKTLWPNAWRSGIVVFGLYLTITASTLVCNYFLGLAQTATYGLSFQLAAVLSQISRSAVLIKLPYISQLRVQARTAELAETMISRVWFFILLYALGTVVIVLSGPWIFAEVIQSRTPLLGPIPLFLLFIVVGLETHHGIYREFALTANVNPFVSSTLVSGIFVVVAGSLGAHYFGILGMIGGYGLVQVLFNNWWIVGKGIQSSGVTGPEFCRLFFTFPFRKARYFVWGA